MLNTSGAGPQPDNFDPFLTSNLQIEHAVFPLSNSITTGTNQLQQNTATANFTYSQGFISGTSLSVGFNNNRQAQTNKSTPQTPAGPQSKVTQPGAAGKPQKKTEQKQTPAAPQVPPVKARDLSRLKAV